jgi:hypothetical protein
MLLNMLTRIKPSSLYVRDAATSRTRAEIKGIEIVDIAETRALTRAFTSKTEQRIISSNVFVRTSSSIVDYSGLTGENTQRTFPKPSGITLIFRECARFDSGFTPM